MEYGREEADAPEKMIPERFKFYEDYNKFMEEIISKRYAREAKTNSPDGWNIMVFITHISPEN